MWHNIISIISCYHVIYIDIGSIAVVINLYYIMDLECLHSYLWYGIAQTANTLRSNFENEAKRVKADMRAQMERLRSTMSNVLQQGEGESKVLEMQNAMLFNDLKTAQDEIAAMKEIKAQVDDEMSSLRKELGNLQQETKAALAESKDLRMQVRNVQNNVQY